jgi:hypothetical protein
VTRKLEGGGGVEAALRTMVAGRMGGVVALDRRRETTRWDGAGLKGCCGLGRLCEIPRKIETGCQGYRVELME